jgi:hypothetical protein
MHRGSLIAACLIGLAAAPAPAATLDFAFSFTNQFASGNGVGGLVLGEVLGLEDNATGRAVSVKVPYNEAGLGIGEYVSAGSPPPNAFTLVNGRIATFDFQSAGMFNAAPAVTCCTLSMIRTAALGPISAGFSTSPSGVTRSDMTGFEFTLINDPGPPPVPVPAPLALLLAALAGLSWVGRVGRLAPSPG